MRLGEALLLTQVLAAAWWVWKGRPCRIFVAAFQLLFLWCTFWAGLMAGMSMSGDWL
jgi:hypothetical protein